MLDWVSRFNICSFLDNHLYQLPGHSKECIAGAGCISTMHNRNDYLKNSGNFILDHSDWIFGHLGFDLKNEMEEFRPSHSSPGEKSESHSAYVNRPGRDDPASSNTNKPGRDDPASSITNKPGRDDPGSSNTNKPGRDKPGSSITYSPGMDSADLLGFADAFFFVPEYVLILDNREISIGSYQPDHEEVYREILASHHVPVTSNRFSIRERIDRDEYLSIIRKLKEHILRGDCYEINFCQEYFAEQAQIDPVTVYRDLSSLSPNPFSAFYRVDESYLLCASPERYLKRTGRQIISQPIKGTAPRDKVNADHDLKLKEQLSASPKEKSENVMVVDLVRNDLSKVCVEGSVKVDELFGVYEFPQLFQMISTVSGLLREGVEFEDIIRASFPMGSMTGAPKKRVLELVDQYEKSRRGLFSGAVGYISPEKDFDFNVVIRSILYNAREQYLSFQAGSGITFYSDPEKEYGECQLKASAIKKVLGAV